MWLAVWLACGVPYWLIGPVTESVVFCIEPCVVDMTAAGSVQNEHSACAGFVIQCCNNPLIDQDMAECASSLEAIALLVARCC
jgi:hypothetical protein